MGSLTDEMGTSRFPANRHPCGVWPACGVTPVSDAGCTEPFVVTQQCVEPFGGYGCSVFPRVKRSIVPTITKDQMVEVDRIMVDELGIDLVRMMENAGRGLARLVLAQTQTSAGEQNVVVLAGTGGNGGGALVAARRLAGWGLAVTAHLTQPASSYSGIVAQQLEISSKVGVAIADFGSSMPQGDGALIVDGVIGYSLSGGPHGRAADLIRWATSTRGVVVALDVPSGVDAASGRAYDPAIVADATLTLALPKAGLDVAGARTHVGDLYVCDIGVPASLYRDAFALDVSGLFSGGGVVRLVDDA